VTTYKRSKQILMSSIGGFVMKKATGQNLFNCSMRYVQPYLIR